MYFCHLGFLGPQLEERSMRKSIAAVALVAAASLAVVGIAPAASSAPTLRPAADGVSVAKAIVAKYSKNPTSLGNLTPLPKAPPKGKYVITITNETDAAITLNRNIVEGGKSLGWKMESLQAEGTIEGQRATLTQAIAKKPDGIAVSGMETESYGDLYKKAAAAGIAVICSACLSAPGSGLLDSHIANAKLLDLWGQMIAAFAVANTNGKAKVQQFGTSIYPVLVRYDTSFAKNLKKLCPTCTTKFNELDFAGIPAQVANVYKANPGTNFISSDLGDFFPGVPQALFTVGAKPGSAPLIGGLTAGKGNIEQLKSKVENAWTGYSLPIVGYSVIDSFARLWTNVPFAKADLPTQILTQKNVGTAVFTPQGDYLGIKDYKQQFAKLWKS